MYPSSPADADANVAPNAAKANDAAVTADNIRTSLLNKLFKVDPDIQLWLKYSGYFNLARREFTLDKLRKLEALEDERSELLLELGTPVSAVAAHKDEAIISVATKLPNMPSVPAAGDKLKQAEDGAPSVIPCKRSAVPEPFPAAPRSPPPTRQSAANVPLTASSSSAPNSTCVTPQVATSTVPQVAPVASTTSPSTSQGPARLKDSRFFLVKCSNTANIYMSQRDGMWVTQAKNEALFAKAFKECESVILFFSINKSRYFQGFARMTSLPDAKLEKPDWIKRINLTAVTEPFTVEWMNQSDTSFDDVGDLRNSLNDYRSVVVGRDGQEYPVECARKMMAIMSQTTQKQPPVLRPIVAKSNAKHSYIWRSPTKAAPKSLKADRGDPVDRADRLNWRPRPSESSSSDDMQREGTNPPNLIDFQGQL
ncbi:hypothetical protein CDD81_934 [Ophiocordyceps australis]|uniref:YTH domain-containing protein n=1 Tax=Ophiocordyceps australis TaxID=1399860 RepID=A0A2C5YE58_9HYPO|nr:hypothetical protein CDD81_934 [Ophiocordyceps australis]